MMTKNIFFFLVLLLSSLGFALAQERAIEGFIYIDQKEPAEMALVALHADSITANPSLVTYTDKRGYYRLNLGASLAKHYLLEVQYIGYLTTTKALVGDSIQGAMRCDLNLETAAQTAQLQEVVVTAKRKMGIDRKSYRFSREQIKQAKSSLDLALTLPQIKAEARTGRIASATGETAPIILINGHYATNEELRSIPPSKIIRIDYFDIAPERYNARGSVLDVITKPLDNGHHAGVEASVAPFATDAAARLYYNYNSGAHQFKLFTNNFIRHTNLGKQEEQTSEYTTTKRHLYESVGTTHTRLNSHMLKASYAFNQQGKRHLEVSLSTSLEKSNNPQSYDALVQIGNEQQRRLGEVTSGGQVFTPVVDVYYDRTLSSTGSRLFSNLVYTHNQAHTEYNLVETLATTKKTALEERLTGKTSKNSLIAQVEYAHPLKSGWLYIGSHLMYSHALFRLNGISTGESQDKQDQWRDRTYLSWEGSIGKFFYRLTPALNLHYVSAHKGLDQAQMRWSFNPRLLIGYRLPNNHLLRWEVETANQIPELGETTEAMRQIREGLFVRNNPKLENSYLATTRLYHSWSHPRIELSNTLAYNYTDRDWVLSFKRNEVNGKTAIIRQRRNALYSQYVTFKTSVGIKPLGDERLIIRLYAQPRYQHYRLTKAQEISLFSIPAGASVTYQYNNWGVQGDLDLPYQRLYSYFISSTGWYSSLSGFWSKGPWNIRLAVENLFVPESTQMSNHQFLELQERSKVMLRDNCWKASLSIAYYFSIGKSFRGERLLENEDSDRGIF
ncbi:MAG: hypothetical protein PUG74_12370 [Prevotellaceae bacterium]|nr:hypothetical protein [Prevotellaceae bacterium]